MGNETFCLTYGDGVSNVNIGKLIQEHKVSNMLVTLTAVQQPGRFGAFMLNKNDNRISNFREKPKADGQTEAWINGGFFIVEPQAIDYISDDNTVWEKEPLEILARTNKLGAFKHYGFWQPMDTLRDKNVLDDLWNSGKAPWKLW
jgi:glucose-1-phosphate cytidylyltransferase